MINVGFYDDVNSKWEDECLLDVSDKIVLVSDYKSEAQAQNAAKSNPATLEIERLAAKLEVMIGGSLEVGPFEDGTNASLGPVSYTHLAMIDSQASAMLDTAYLNTVRPS